MAFQRPGAKNPTPPMTKALKGLCDAIFDAEACSGTQQEPRSLPRCRASSSPWTWYFRGLWYDVSLQAEHFVRSVGRHFKHLTSVVITSKNCCSPLRAISYGCKWLHHIIQSLGSIAPSPQGPTKSYKRQDQWGHIQNWQSTHEEK